jgi:hypothetical protein
LILFVEMSCLGGQGEQMTANWTIALQILGIILQVLNAVNVAQLPTGWQAAVTGLVTILQAVQGIIAHYYTPTGVSITPGASITTTQGGTQAASTSK